MQTESITHRTKHIHITRMTAGYCLLILSSYLLSVIFSDTTWFKYESVLHTYLELAFVFMTLSSFIIVFLTHEVNTNSSRIIGYGLLAVTIYNILHINFNFMIKQYSTEYSDISYIYWILGRYSESIVLLVSLAKLFKLRVNRLNSLLITMAVIITAVIFTACIMRKVHYDLSEGPIFAFTDSAAAGVKIGLIKGIEYSNIILYIAALFFALKRFSSNKKVKYRYICIGILFVIQAEVCFDFNFGSPFFMSLGRIFKIVYSYHLFMGLFSSAVLNPYENLEKTRKMIQESQNELRKILNGLPVAILTFDSKGRVRFANQMAEKLLECKSKDILYNNMEQLDSKFKSEESIKAKYNKYLENFSGKYNNVMRFSTLKGNKISLDVTVYKYKNGILASFTDVKKEQELANLKVQSRTILNAIDNCVAIIDSKRSILNCNSAFLNFIDINDEADIIGRNFDEFSLSLKCSALPEVIKSTENNNLKQNKECSFVTQFGNRKEFIYHEAPVVNIDNETLGYAIVFTDITELKKEQRKVINQEKLAIIGQMGSGIVHETKNYLASIKGYCQLLSIKVKDEHLLKYIQKIDNISEDVNKVIAEFLSLGKPTENDTMDVVSLREVLESIRYMLESPSFIKGVKMVLDLSENESEIIANEAQIKQVVLNMAKNAIEAMNNVNDAKLDIKTSLSDSGKEMILMISDNGRGISKENISLLGTPFYTTKETGTGLGLNVCYRIIKEHGGHIDVLSEEGKGTTFLIYLPCFIKE